MSNIKECRLKRLYECLELKQIILKNFKVFELEKKILVIYKKRVYFITLEEKFNDFYWILKPFKDSVFQVKVDNDIDFNLLIYTIEEDQDYHRYMKYLGKC